MFQLRQLGLLLNTIHCLKFRGAVSLQDRLVMLHHKRLSRGALRRVIPYQGFLSRKVFWFGKAHSRSQVLSKTILAARKLAQSLLLISACRGLQELATFRLCFVEVRRDVERSVGRLMSEAVYEGLRQSLCMAGVISRHALVVSVSIIP